MPKKSRAPIEERPRPMIPGSDGARELYQREKARRAAKARPASEEDPLVAAKREYETMLANQAAAGKGGRPRKQPVAKKSAD